MAKNPPADANKSASPEPADFSALYPNRKPEELAPVTLYNQSVGALHHDEFKLLPGASLEVPQFIADIWLDVTHLGKPRAILLSERAKGTPAISAAEAEALRAEKALALEANGALSAENANLAKLVAQLQGQIAAGNKPGKRGQKDADSSEAPAPGGGES